MKVGIIDPVPLPLASANAVTPSDFEIEEQETEQAAQEQPACSDIAPNLTEVRSSFLALLSDSPERILSQHLDGGFVRKLADMYPSRSVQAALSQIAEESAARGLNPRDCLGFVTKHRPSAESIIRFSDALMARSPASRKSLLETIDKNAEKGFYYGLINNLEAHPAFDDFKNVLDVELFQVIASKSALPREDLAIFDMLRTHGIARIKRYYREGFKSIPPIRITEDSYALDFDNRFVGVALSALGKSPVYEERPGSDLSSNRIMSRMQWPFITHSRNEPTIFEANLLAYVARRKIRPGWLDIMSAIVKFSSEEREATRDRILSLLPDMILDGSLNDFVTNIKAFAEDDGVFEFIERHTGSIAALNRHLEAILVLKQEGRTIDWNAVTREPEVVAKDAYALHLRRHHERFPEKPIEQVRSEFLSVTNGPAIPEAELDAAIATYEKILNMEAELVALSNDELRARVAHAREKDALDPVEFLALARDVARREFGIYPYNTQMLTIVLLTASHERYPKGRVAQVATGEGKSLVFAMLAAYIASQGTGVDVFTSNDYLAGRDAGTFVSFYRWFGLSAHAFRHRRWNADESRNADIRYGPCSEFRWAGMLAALNGDRLFAKPGKIGLVDEVDNLIIDEGNTPAIISASIATFLPARFFEAIYHYMMEVDDLKKPHDLSRLKKNIERIADVPDLENQLASRNPKRLKQALGLAQVCRNIESLTNEALLFLIEQARKARRLERNRDYIVKNDGPYDHYGREVVIVDRENTGRIREGHVWSNGLHRFVELKELHSCSDEEVTSFSSSAQVFYRGYERLYALTGTIGDRVDQHELRNKYGLAGFAVPTHMPSRRDDRPLMIVATDAQRDKIAARLYPIAFSRGSNRESAPPILVMFGSIEEAEAHYHKKLRSRYIDGIQVVTGEFKKNSEWYSDDWQHAIFPSNEDDAIARAGGAGMLTVATPIFGRGTDIVPTPEAVAAGGLTSIQMFLPKNLRVEMQGRGRAGRQGKPGKSYVIASLESDATLRQMPAVTKQLEELFGPKWPANADALKLFFLLRDAEHVIDLLEKDVQLELDERHHEYQSRYFDLMNRAKKELERVQKNGKQLKLGDHWVVMFGGKIFSQIRKVNELMTEANERWAHAYTLYSLLSEAVRTPNALAPLDPPDDDYRRLFDEIAASAAADGMDPDVLAQVRESFYERLRMEYAKSAYRRQQSLKLLDDIVGGALKEIDALLG